MRVGAIVFALLVPFLLFSQVEKVEDVVGKALEVKESIQKEREKWDRERRALVEEYKRLCDEEAFLEERLKSVEEALSEERKRVDSLEKVIKESGKIKGGIKEHISRSLFELKRFVECDLPFRRDERIAEIERVEVLLEDPKVLASEKYKAFAELLKKELSYSYTVGVYRDTVRVGENELYVEVLRVGRIVLYFRTPDGKRVGWYVPGEGWKELPRGYRRSINMAFEMAGKKRPVELLKLPVGRLER